MFSGDLFHLLNDLLDAGQVPPGEQDSDQTQVARVEHGQIPATLDQFDASGYLIECPIQIIQLGQRLTPYRQQPTPRSRLRQSEFVSKLQLLLAK